MLDVKIGQIEKTIVEDTFSVLWAMYHETLVFKQLDLISLSAI